MKILTVGGATRDIFIDQTSTDTVELTRDGHTDNYLIFKEGTKLEVQRIQHLTGGGSTNSAVSFSHLGFDTAAYFKLGNDRQGEFILRVLNSLNVDTRYSLTSTNVETALSFIIASESHNDTILAYRGSNAYLQPDELPLESLNQFDALYITSLSGPSSQILLPLVKAAKKHTIPVAINPGSAQLLNGATTLVQALEHIDTLILNADEAELLWHSLENDASFSLPDYCKEILTRGPKTVVVTDGANGVYAATGNTMYFQPSAPAQVVSTVGAGDAFGSCFTAHMLTDSSIEQALLAGVINSASVISQLGAKQGLLTKKQLAKKIKSTDTNPLQTFKLP